MRMRTLCSLVLLALAAPIIQAQNTSLTIVYKNGKRQSIPLASVARIEFDSAAVSEVLPASLSVSSVSPSEAPRDKWTTFTVRGTGFQRGCTLTLVTHTGRWPIPASDARFVSADQLDVRMFLGPQGAPYTATLEVRNPDGTLARSTFRVR